MNHLRFNRLLVVADLVVPNKHTHQNQNFALGRCRDGNLIASYTNIHGNLANLSSPVVGSLRFQVRRYLRSDQEHDFASNIAKLRVDLMTASLID